MTRIILCFSALIISLSSRAQVNPIDFETPGNGANWIWTVFENGVNPPLEIVGNPDVTGINTSATVSKFRALTTGMPYAGFESQHGQGVGTFSLTSANCVVKIMVNKPIISPVGIKFATASGASTGEILVSNTLINQWEELTFDFTPIITAPSSTGIDQIIIFPDFAARIQSNICYIDHIVFSSQDSTLNQAPMEPAPTPQYAGSNVMALFSHPYTELPVNSWLTPWSQGSLNDINIVGNATKRYSSLDFVGVETVGANVLNLLNMTHMRLDVWTPNTNPFKVKLVDFGNDGQYAGGDDSEHELSFQPTFQSWNTFEIALNQFLNLNAQEHIAQIIFSGQPVGTGLVFIDNVLFYKESGADLNEEAIQIETYPNPFQDYLIVKSTQNMESLKIFDGTGRMIYAQNELENEITLDLKNLTKGAFLLKIVTQDGEWVKKIICVN